MKDALGNPKVYDDNHDGWTLERFAQEVKEKTGVDVRTRLGARTHRGCMEALSRPP